MKGNRRQELANSISHGIGLALSVAGSAVLIVYASLYGRVWHIVGCSVFGVSLILLYTASTLYHGFRSPRVKRVFKILDHAAIYILIAGTYTPFTLVNLHGEWGWTLFGLVWGISLAGILFKIWFVDHFKIVSTTIYLALGWLVVIAIRPLLTLVPMGGVLWLLAGGLAYSTGVIFFAWKKLPYNHTIWHVFVLVGSICHYVAVLRYVVPAKI